MNLNGGRRYLLRRGGFLCSGLKHEPVPVRSHLALGDHDLRRASPTSVLPLGQPVSRFPGSCGRRPPPRGMEVTRRNLGGLDAAAPTEVRTPATTWLAGWGSVLGTAAVRPRTSRCPGGVRPHGKRAWGGFPISFGRTKNLENLWLGCQNSRCRSRTDGRFLWGFRSGERMREHPSANDCVRYHRPRRPPPPLRGRSDFGRASFTVTRRPAMSVRLTFSIASFA